MFKLGPFFSSFMPPQEKNGGTPVNLAPPKREDGLPLVVNTNGHDPHEAVERNGRFYNKTGMHWIVTALFIVGETAGGGLIALPSAMVASGVFWGTVTSLVGAVICTYTGAQLADNWIILQKRWPEYRKHCRKPYPAMGERALGQRFSYFVSILLDVTMFGTAVVFLLLAAKNIETFLSMGGYQVGFCHLIVVVAIFMLPATMLKSPKDFWWAIILAMFTTMAAVFLVIYGSVSDGKVCQFEANYPAFNIKKAAMGFGTVMFAYGGHGAFPTIQHDMKKPHQFRNAVVLAFFIVTALYLPVSLAGYYAYGDSLLDTIIPSLQKTEIRFGVNMLITIHVILALTIVFNPLNQELEDYANIPQDFCWQRVLIRSCVMACVVLVGISIPSFGVLLDLVGGSTITTMALVFPAIFNLYLKAGAKKYKMMTARKDEELLTFKEVLEHTSRKDLIVNVIVLLFAILGGLFATIAALNAMIYSDYATPCWWGAFSDNSSPESIPRTLIPINCCGAFKNISIYSGEVCMDLSGHSSGGIHD